MRKLLQVVAFLSTLIVGTACMVVIVTQTSWFKDWLRGFIVRQARGYVNGEVAIGRLDGNMFFGVELENIDVTMEGLKVVELKDVGIDYNFWTFISGNVVLDSIRLNKPVLRLVKDQDGWNLMRLVKARTPDRPRNRRPLEIGEIGVSDATLYMESGKPGTAVATAGMDVPDVIDKIDAAVAVKSDADALKIDIKHVSLRTQQPAFGLNSLSGVITRTKDGVTFDGIAIRTEESSLSASGSVKTAGDTPVLDVHASSDKLALDEFAKIVPALRRYPFQPAFEVTASGPMDNLNVALKTREKLLGEVDGTLRVDAQAPTRRIAGDVFLRHFNLGPLLNDSRANSDIVGNARIDLALPEGRSPLSGTYAANLPHVTVAGYSAANVKASGRVDGPTIRLKVNASGYGGHATASGTVIAGAPLRLDLQGHAAHVDMRDTPPQLKMPGAPSNLEFDYTLSGRGSVYSGTLRFDESTLADATIAKGTTAAFQFGGGAPSYSGQGTVANLDAQKIGHAFAIPVLEQDRFKSRIDGTFTVSGSGGGQYPFSLDASGTMTDSEMFAAKVPRMDFSTQFGGGDAHVKALGTFEGLDPQVPIGDPRYAGSLTGAVDVDTTIRDYVNGVSVDNFDARGRVNLGRSELRRLTIESAAVDGQYANREGQVTQLTVTGPDLNAAASGRIALDDKGASNLTVHAETPSLDRLGEIVGQPMTGAAVVDATVTGNGETLKADGTLKGSNLGSGENNALNVESELHAVVAQLAWADAKVDARTHATFIQVAGQKLNELTADTTYSQSRLAFHGTAKQGTRELSADGSALLHPDHQEIHLGNLSFASEGVVWRSAPGSKAAIQYGRDRVVVDHVALVNGNQRIEANGVVGSEREALEVRAENVDVAQAEKLLLSDYGISGSLNASGKVTGSVQDPRFDGTFTLAPGAFQQVKFESFGGTLQYSGKGFTLDSRLQQTPTAWLTAKGYVPLALFGKDEHSEAEAAGDHAHEEARPGEAVNLEIASSQIDLGVVQGFTSYVTNVTGALQANVKLTGSAHDPHMDGAIDIHGGGFTVPDLGTSYTGLDTRIELQPDKINVAEMRLMDAHKKTMTIGGSLAVHAREVGGVDIHVKSNEFKIIDNKSGKLLVDTDLAVKGDVREPRLTGTLEIRQGMLNVADILERATTDPYATEETDFEKLTVPKPTLFDGLTLNLGIGVPSSLVLKGSDIRAANAAVSIGDVTATVGGAISLRKGVNQKVRIIGEVNTVRGSYTFQGRRFDIMRDGRVRFSGGEEINPVLDVKARRVIAGIEAFVNVRGTLDQPELVFSSNPPLDQTDILSLIIFNQPASQLGEGQQVSLAQEAGALAGGYLASGLVRSIGNALQLDEFDLQAVGDNGAGASLTVGEQVGEKMFVKIRQGFGADQATEFLLEYQLKDYLRFQGSVAEAPGGVQRQMFRRVERGGLDLIFFFSY